MFRCPEFKLRAPKQVLDYKFKKVGYVGIDIKTPNNSPK